MVIEIAEAKRLLDAEYEKAKKLEYVKNPLAYAVYQVWKIVDRRGVKNKILFKSPQVAMEKQELDKHTPKI